MTDSPRVTATFSRRQLAIVAMTVLCLYNLWATRENLFNVAPFNDEVLHSQMSTFATNSLLHFHWPFTQWYPYLNVGGPQFLHYQGLGATLSGILGLFVGPSLAFRLSLWLLMGLWPLAIYLAARTFGLTYGPATLAAFIAPTLASVPGVGYEAHAYVWLGYGVWAQLCASWALPFAWAWTWRALTDPRHLWKAAFFISLTCGLHYETGYGALLAVPILVVVQRVQLVDRMRRGALLLVGSALAASWVLVPLLTLANYAAINSGQNTTDWARGYGAKTNLSWLVGGNYLDHQRWPVVTCLLGLGVLALVAQWRRFPIQRALFLLTAGLFMISWGPTTWHGFIAIIPGHQDIFFRRFLGPIQLGCIFLAGTAPFMVHEAVSGWFADRERTRPAVVAHLPKVLMAVSLFVVAIAGWSTWGYYKHNARAAQYQVRAQHRQHGAIDPIIAFLQSQPNARVYAGTPVNWGKNMVVGVGPLFMYLADKNISQVSTEAWSASLMEVPQEMFYDKRVSDFQLFDVQYIVMPKGMHPSVPATLLFTSGPFTLWNVLNVSPLSIITDAGRLAETKATIVRSANQVLRTSYFFQHAGFVVNFPSTTPTYVPPVLPRSSVGEVVTSNVSLNTGTATAFVTMHQAGALVLSASYDPGWRITVDGKTTMSEMIAPALLGVHLSPGLHTVVFTYVGFQWYLPLLLLSLASLIGLYWWFRRWEPANTDNEG